MAQFTSKELYMMNGGDKLYIYKDGFGGDYRATPEEEAQWKKEVIDRKLADLDTLNEPVRLRSAIDGLIFHNYPNAAALFEDKLLKEPPGVRQIVFAAALWKYYRYEKSFAILLQNFQLKSADTIPVFFNQLIDFKNHNPARQFLEECLTGDDDAIAAKAKTALGMWAYNSAVLAFGFVFTLGI